MPLRPRQIMALARAVGRELLWGLPAVARVLDGWRLRARAIPDVALREDALDSIARKRGHADGAALFWILPRRRHPELLALLVAYQTIWDFLDNVSERGAHRGHANGEALHRALVEALDPAGAISAHYRHHTHDGDGGYLSELVRSARAECSTLPAFARVRPLALAQAADCAIQTLNHDPDPERRDAALKEWAAARGGSPWAARQASSPWAAGRAGSPWSAQQASSPWAAGRAGSPWSAQQASSPWAAESTGSQSLAGTPPPGAHELSWFEQAAAASASLVPHVLLALAAEARWESGDVARAYAAYMPWASLATAMLDSYSDRLEDVERGDHSYVSHYEESRLTERLGQIVARATGEVRCLRGGDRHAIIVACVVALYLSKDSARDARERARTDELVRAGGSLSRALLPVLRAWRAVHALRAV